jgi:hypothetical protein
MWRYEKDKLPRWDASPRTATRIDGHLADPDNETNEEILERRLAREFEDPVNQFLFLIGQPDFRATDEQRRQLTFYVTLLFLRSEARKKASGHTQEVMRHAMNKFLANDLQVFNVSAKWSIDLLLSGKMQAGLFTQADVVKAAHKFILDADPTIEAKKSYVRLIEAAMESVDERLLTGQWDHLTTTPDKPFVISDAPVVTWQRNAGGFISHGGGFHRPDVEVFMPVSPTLCLHIQPSVPRTRPVARPSVDDINAAQASMSTRYCYTNVCSLSVDRVVQEWAGSAELGVKSFTVWHRNYDYAFYEIFMNGGKWKDPPRL